MSKETLKRQEHGKNLLKASSGTALQELNRIKILKLLKNNTSLDTGTGKAHATNKLAGTPVLRKFLLAKAALKSFAYVEAKLLLDQVLAKVD